MRLSSLKRIIREEVGRQTSRRLTEASTPSKNLQGNKDRGSIVITFYFNHKQQKNNSSRLWNRVIGLINSNQGKLLDYTVTDSVAEFELVGRSNADQFIKTMNSEIPGYITGYSSFDIYKV
jgi:hypothetical protein